MNSVRDRFRNAAAFFWQHPVLWLPVLVANLCKSVFAQADTVLRHAVIVWLMPQSVLGGYGGSTSLPTAPIVLGSLLKGLANTFDLFCYLYAFALLAKSVPLVQRGKELNGQLLKEFPARIWQTLGWSALAWMSLPIGIGVGMLMPRASVEMTYAFEAVFMALALYLLVPVLRYYIQVNSRTDSSMMGSRSADFCLLIFAVVTSTAADHAFLQYARHDQGLSQLATHTIAWWLLTTCVSTAFSLPYAFAMIGATLRELPPGIFVYGTLHPDRAPAEIRDEAKQLVWRSEGSIAGQLQDLGEYPALLPSTAGQTVEGAVLYLPSSDKALLAAFDHYEGYDPASPETSLFLRELRPVTFPDGHTERHWVYVYNRELPATE